MDAYIQENLLQYTCLHCRKQCACQAPEFAASHLRSSRSDGEKQLFTTEAAHPFAHGDDVTVRGHAPAKLSGTYQVAVVSATSFALKENTGRGKMKQSCYFDLGRDGAGGQVRMRMRMSSLPALSHRTLSPAPALSPEHRTPTRNPISNADPNPNPPRHRTRWS